MQKSKRARLIAAMVEKNKEYGLGDAISLLQSVPPLKFIATVQVSIKLRIDVKKPDQQVRGMTVLPVSTGISLRVLVITTGENIKKAEMAGADMVGGLEYVEKIKEGWLDFDLLVVTPDMMREVSQIARILGPRGLMPNPKSGSVTTDLEKAVREFKAGKIEYRADKSGVVHIVVGKVDSDSNALKQNIEAIFHMLTQTRPSSVKGKYIGGAVVSSTMGPGLHLDIAKLM